MDRYRIYIIGMALCASLLALCIPGSANNTAPVKPIVYDGEAAEATFYLDQFRSDGRAYVLAQIDVDRPPSVDLGQGVLHDDKYKSPKSPLKAFIYSAVLPGAGQLYTGSKTKAALFLGLEALSWAGYFVYDSKGNDKTQLFEDFANTHWSEPRYSDFIETNWPQSGGDDDYAYDQWGNLVFTHHLPDTKTQQYYEMIGKYDQFVFGWDDVDTLAYPPTYASLHSAYSANRMHYENMRHDANNMFDRSKASLYVAMANRVISGVEAALAAKKHNRKVSAAAQRISLRADVARVMDNYFPMLTMTYKF